jgi:predicted aspartyl protease
MPHFTLPFSPQGPIVDAGVMVSAARQQALLDANLPVPSPQLIRALIDTGAGISGVDPSVLNALGLQPTGEAEIHTPSTGGVPVKTPTYDVTVAILAGRSGDAHFISDTIQVTATALEAQGFGYKMLLGRDILKSCILYFNGADEVFSLCY